MKRPLTAALILSPLLLAGCSATLKPMHAPSDVLRYHLGDSVERGTLSVVPASAAPTISPEFQTFADAVSAELGQAGYTLTPGNANSAYEASVLFVRTSKGQVRADPPLRIGLGGGTASGGFGVSAGASLPAGKSVVSDVIETRLTVLIRRRADQTTVWEGHAVTTGVAGTGETDAAKVAPKLAAALFKGFPGESGITISVP